MNERVTVMGVYFSALDEFLRCLMYKGGQGLFLYDSELYE